MDGYEDPVNRRPYAWDNPNLELLEHYKMLGKIHKEFGNEDCVINALKGIIEIKRGCYVLTVDLVKENFSIVKK